MMNERKAFGYAAFGAGFIVLPVLLIPAFLQFSKSFVHPLATASVLSVLNFLLLASGWLLQLPFVRLVAARMAPRRLPLCLGVTGLALAALSPLLAAVFAAVVSFSPQSATVLFGTEANIVQNVLALLGFAAYAGLFLLTATGQSKYLGLIPAPLLSIAALLTQLVAKLTVTLVPALSLFVSTDHAIYVNVVLCAGFATLVGQVMLFYYFFSNYTKIVRS